MSMSIDFAFGPPICVWPANAPGSGVPPGATLAYTMPSAIQATASRLPSPAATCTSVTSPGVGSTRSGARQPPANTREMNACVTPAVLAQVRHRTGSVAREIDVADADDVGAGAVDRRGGNPVRPRSGGEQEQDEQRGEQTAQDNSRSGTPT